MARSLLEIVPDVQTLLDLEAPELAGPILQHLCSLPPNETSLFHLGNYTGHLTNNSHSSPVSEKHWREVDIRIAEAWAWLSAQGLIAPRVGDGTHGWVFVTRLGRKAGTASGYVEFRKAQELLKEKLHPSIAEKCFGHFIRGLFDTAVFEAYKALEIAIRDVGKFGPDEYGKSLARKAFDPFKGPLTDLKQVVAEREALADLMAGALGSYKNPASHRNVDVSADEAAEMIVLASHLLRIVDARRKP